MREGGAIILVIEIFTGVAVINILFLIRFQGSPLEKSVCELRRICVLFQIY